MFPFFSCFYLLLKIVCIFIAFFHIRALQRIAVRFDKNRNVDSLIVTKQGGNVAEIEQGTWATDYRIAMRFAQWLSPEFSLKVTVIFFNFYFVKLFGFRIFTAVFKLKKT